MKTVKDLTDEELDGFAKLHNVFVDKDTRSYNNSSQDAVYGWRAIPESWITDLLERTGKTEVIEALASIIG